MKVFFDCEFTGLRQNTTLISIGLVTENGEEFYAEFNDYDRSQADDWIQENVIDRLILGKLKPGEIIFHDKTKAEERPLVTMAKGNYLTVRTWLALWLRQEETWEFWGDCLAYDWVLFRRLFDGQLPDNIYYIPFDLSTLFKLKRIDPDISREEFAGPRAYDVTSYPNAIELWGKNLKHNALWDAKVIKACYERAMAWACPSCQRTDAIMWNPFNSVMQCHSCGQVV